METYPIPMVPGPVRVPEAVLQAYAVDYGSPDLETEYLDLYNRTEQMLQTILATRNRVTIQTGEGMLALWGALKSCLRPGDRVLSIATGVFGYGVGDLARSVGAEVCTLGFGYDQTVSDWAAVEKAVAEFKPKMITIIHCETPSGTLNPLAELGAIKRKYNVPLLYVDAVASLAGAPVLTDDWGIDLLLGGSQKALSMPPCMSLVAVSPKAWEVIEDVNYAGYDALKPFSTAQRDFYFPYTPYWHGTAALYAGAKLILDEGLEKVFARHAAVAEQCRSGLQELGYELFPAAGAISAPTVTAVKLPGGMDWADFDRRARAKGLVVGGSYGPMAGKVFRLGHMGSQADPELMARALEVLKQLRD
ncbi:MAG: alanine--glyoxylate aminotransferase family protein [Anaerolineae bacterium]|nr:alanine--glyoxylate aminotransferase family protein [Anaerolineae bacterium]